MSEPSTPTPASKSESAAAAPTPAVAATSKSASKERAPLLSGHKDGPPQATHASVRGTRAAVSTTAAGVKREAAKGGGAIRVLLMLTLLLLVASIAGGVWVYKEKIEPRLAAAVPVSAAPPPAAAPEPAAVNVTGMRTSLDAANAKIAQLQKQLDAQREQRERTEGRLQEMADRMALVIKQSSFVPSADQQRVSSSDAAQVAAMLPTVSPSTSELILLKERNRLASYGDRAIATGNREALQNIVNAMMDPAMRDLFHAAQAEFKRVQAYYEISVSIDPGYKLPVSELFKESSARVEADLAPAQLHALLLDYEKPWEARLRAAYLLRGSNAPGTDETLLKAIKEDPSLDVAKQAQTTLEKRIGRRFRLFDIPAMEAWWQAQGPAKKTPVPMKEPSK